MKAPLKAFLILALIAQACSKDENTQGNQDLTYGNSIFYVRASDYTISPLNTGSGTYNAFPDNLNMDPATGKITVSIKDRDGKATQTGLKYRITYTSPSGSKDTTYITLAGINFQDRFYYLSNNDSIATPIYNSDPASGFPGGNFTRSNGKLEINPATGAINLTKSIRNGLFNDDPANGRWRVVNIEYSTNDQSQTDKNNLDVVVYLYNSLADVPVNVSEAMRAHQELLVGISPVAIPVTNAPIDNDIKNIVSAAKPRPPCIIIIK